MVILSCSKSMELTDTQLHIKAQINQVFAFLFAVVVLQAEIKNVILKGLEIFNELFDLILHLFPTFTCSFRRILIP